MELPLSEEYGESEDIDPAAAASAAARIAEFVSASEGVFGMGTYEGPGHGANYAIVQSRVPSDFAHAEREEGGAWRAHIIPRISPTLSRKRVTPGEHIWPSGPRSRRTSPGL